MSDYVNTCRQTCNTTLHHHPLKILGNLLSHDPPAPIFPTSLILHQITPVQEGSLASSFNTSIENSPFRPTVTELVPSPPASLGVNAHSLGSLPAPNLFSSHPVISSLPHDLSSPPPLPTFQTLVPGGRGHLESRVIRLPDESLIPPGP